MNRGMGNSGTKAWRTKINPMIDRERFVQVLLRVVGTAGLTAAFFVMAPDAWMAAIHRALGMGELPDAPVVGYLARSSSALHAVLGGLFWAVSFDLERHRPVLGWMGLLLALFGIAMLAVNFASGMPVWWSLAEGPFNLLFGMALLWYVAASGPRATGSQTDSPDLEPERPPR
jgi:hypothetical protein